MLINEYIITTTLEMDLAVSYKVKHNAAILLLSIYPSKMKTYVHTEICMLLLYELYFQSPRGTTMVHTYSQILLSNKKEQISELLKQQFG